MKEMTSEATSYGHARILKLYSGYPQSLPLPVAIQHGWTIATAPGSAVRRTPENWYWSVAAERRYAASYPDIATRTSGAPFLYLLKLLDYVPLPWAFQKGSIVFPSHSTRRIGMVCDFGRYAADLAELPGEYRPITVCLYHTDHTQEQAAHFERHGMFVVTNGNSKQDSDFLWNFVRNVHGKRYIFSNQMSSSLLFGVAMGLTAHFQGPDFQVTNPNKYWLNRDYTQHHRTWEAQYRDVFRFLDPDVAYQRQVVDEELGRAQMLSPARMRSLLWRLTVHPKYLNHVLRSCVAHRKQPAG